MSELNIPGYTVEGMIGEGATSTVFRATREGSAYAIKLMKDTGDDPVEAALRFRREAAALARLTHDNLVQVIEGGEAAGRPFMVMELLDGPELTDRIQEGPLPEAAIIELGKMLSGALREVHRRGLVHRDLKPANIIIAKTGPAKIIDFGFVTQTDERSERAPDMVGTLLYAPPEQAGLVKRPIDNRSDLYSLGAVLFECAAGRTPFVADSVPDLLHQLKSTPAPEVRSLRSEIRPSVSGIIAKLLAKEPDERYQTAEGVLWDLENLAELDKLGEAAVLGAHEGRAYEVPFVGRERELSALKKVWAKALQGFGGTALVEGEGGLGKTRLVRELVTDARREALILSCKCQKSEQTPLGPFREAIDDHLATLQALPGERRDSALDRFRKAVGDYAPMLKQLSSGLSEVLKDAPDSKLGPPAPELTYDAVANLIAGLAGHGRSMVFVVDDVQWLDNGSRQVFRRLAERVKNLPLMLVGTARNDQASEAARAGLVKDLGELLTTRVVLGPLTSSEVQQFVAAQLGDHPLDPSYVEKLAVRANGNPFALGEYVRALLDSGAIRPARGTWQVDVSRISDVTLPPDVLALVISRLQALGEETTRVLSHAALIGMNFNKDFLQKVMGSKDLVFGALQQGVAANMIERVEGDNYALVHDRVREALETRLSAEETMDAHQAIAENLDGRADKTADYVFALARHYSKGHLTRTPKRLYETTRAAGTLALEAFANDDAQQFFTMALKLGASLAVPDAEVVGLEEGLGTACARLARLPEATEHLERALSISAAPLVRARLHLGLIAVAVTTWNLARVAHHAQAAMGELGDRLPKTAIGRLFSSLRYRALFWFLKTFSLQYGSLTGESLARAALKSSACAVWYQVAVIMARPKDASYLVGRILYFTHLIGSRREAIQPLYRYLAAALGSTVSAEMGEVLVKIAEQLGDRASIALTRSNLALAYGAMSNFKEGDRRIREQLWDADRAKWLTPRDTATFLLASGSFCAQRGLTHEALEIFNAYRDMAERSRLQTSRDYAPYVVSLGESMLGQFGTANERLSKLPPPDPSPSNFIVYNLILGARLSIQYEQGNDELAEKDIQLRRSLVRRARDFWYPNEYATVWAAYSRLRQYQNAPAEKKAAALGNLRAAVDDLKDIAAWPLRRSHYLILAAALDRITGRTRRALRRLKEAERQAAAADSPFATFEIARERARLAADRGDKAAAEQAAQTALNLALRQGWRHRVRWLRDEFKVEPPQANGLNQSIMRSRFQSVAAKTGATGGTSGDTTTDEYLRALLHVSRASASALDPKKQAQAILDEVIPLLGAERAFLFVKDEQGTLKYRAGRTNDRADLPEATKYSSTVVEKVSSTLKPLVVTGTNDGVLLGSQSAVAHDLRSIIAAPLVAHDKLIGVLYLDNHLVNDVFSRDDAEILLAFAHHIVISLEMSQSARREIERQALEQELQLSASVQTMFLPKQVSFHATNVAVSGFYRPAAQCGGDWWWYDERRSGVLSLFLGDVTGHGAGPAMVTAAVATNVRSPSRGGAKEALNNLNDQLLDLCNERYRMTMVALELDRNAKTLTYVSAGAPPLLVLHQDGPVETLVSPGTPLGSREFRAGLKERPVSVGDRLFVFSDGLYELAMPNGGQLGIRKLSKIFIQTKQMDVENAAKYIVDALDVARQNVVQDDDMTFALVDVL